VSSIAQNARAALSLLALALVAACDDGATAPTTPTTPRPVPVDPVPDVVRPSVARVELDVASLVVEAGSVRRLVATVRDSAGRPLDDRAVAWTSSDGLTASVSDAGVVTALRGGVVTVTATAEGKSAAARVTVAAAYAYDLLFDARTLAPGNLPELWRLDLTMPDADARPVMPPDVPNGPASDMVASPDGSRIAFVAHDGGQSDIYVMNRDGSGLRQVTGTPDNDDQPAWSPDGARIAFRRWNYIGTPHDVWVVNADGTNARNLTADLPGEQRAPTWSPRLADGSVRVAFAHVTRGPAYLRGQIYSVRDDGSDARAVTPLDDARLDDAPAWSPDGRSILFVRTGGEHMGDLWLVDANGANARALMAASVEPPFEQRSPAWSPDGLLIAFTSSHEIIGNRSGDWQIYTVRADGSDLVRRTSTPTDKLNPAWLVRP
jgi:dipeptidyl aminopeptidase/acylaminoacyl peptidase